MLYIKYSTAKELAGQPKDYPIFLMGACVGTVVMVSELSKDWFAFSSKKQHIYFDTTMPSVGEVLSRKGSSEISNIESYLVKVKKAIDSKDHTCDCKEYSRDGRWSYTISDKVKAWQVVCLKN